MKNILKLLCAVSAVVFCAGTGLADAWENLPAWKFGANPCVPDEIDGIVRDTPVDNRGPLEDKLLAVMAATNVTVDAKQYCCRMLRRVGTDKCVPVLAKMLGEPDFSHYAVYALERMQGSEAAGAALRSALDSAPDALKPALLGSLAQRRDTKAVAKIATLTASPDQAVAMEAMRSLGRIGGADSMKALQAVKPADALKAALQNAMLACAESLGAAEAAPVFAAIYAAPCTDAQRGAGLRGLVKTDEAKGCGLIVDALKGTDFHMQQVALRCIAIEPGEAITRAVAGTLAGLSTNVQPGVIVTLANRGDHAALDSVVKCLKIDSPAVRDAAVVAIGKLGDARDVGTLLDLAKTEAKAVDAIGMMTDSNVDEALVKALRAGTSPEAAVKALTVRNYAKAAPELIKIIPTASAEVKSASWKGLRSLAAEADLEPMIKLVGAIKDAAEQDLASVAVKDAFARQGDKAKCLEALSKLYAGAAEPAKVLILEIAQITGGPQALTVVRSAMDKKNKTLYDKALRLLAAWPGREVAPDLLQAAGNAPDDVGKLLALGGYIRLIGLDANNPPAKEKAAMYKDAWKLAKRDDERRLILSGLANVKDADAVKLLTDCLAEAGVRAEAEAAAFQLGDATKNQFKAEVTALMEKIVATSKNQDAVNRAKTFLPPPPAEKK